MACCATAVLECCVPSVQKRLVLSAVVLTAIIHRINEWILLLDTEALGTTAKERLAQAELEMRHFDKTESTLLRLMAFCLPFNVCSKTVVLNP